MKYLTPKQECNEGLIESIRHAIGGIEALFPNPSKDLLAIKETLEQALTQLDTEAKEFEEAERKIREISDLCSNCRNLSDAQAIADGLEGSSTDEGCCKCWVDQLQTQLEAERKE